MDGVKRFETSQTRGLDEELSETSMSRFTEKPPDTSECGQIMEDLSVFLRKTIEGEIIPRLMISHNGLDTSFRDGRSENWSPGAKEIEEFATILLNDAEDAAIQYIEQLVKQGVPLEDIYLALLAPAARLLGDWWTKDRCHFVDVTIGLARLEHLLHLFSAEFEGTVNEQTPGSALFSVSKEEQHTYGIFMLSEFFRRDGWSVWCGAPRDRDEVAQIVSEHWFDVVGLSLSRESLLDDLREDIMSIRGASKNPSTTVMVGGRAFSDNVDLVTAVGADKFAADAKTAVQAAKKLVDLPNTGC